VNDMRRVVVVGSLNCDLVLRTPSLPRPGETRLASSFHTFVGGKGLNQAIAASRAAMAGLSVSMIGRLGGDAFAALLREKMDACGVDGTHVVADESAPTGVAVIAVSDAGENSILVAPNANANLSVADVERAAPIFEGARAVLLQLETPIPAAVRAAELGRAAGALIILNPAPAPADPPRELLGLVDILVPNETEAASLLQSEGIVGDDAAIAAAQNLARAFEREPGKLIVILTLGVRGALVHGRGVTAFVDPVAVDVVDTTAAGDAFCGSLAVALASGDDLEAAARFAAAAGSLACTKLGAEPSLPTRDAVVAAIGRVDAFESGAPPEP
jgi:ribokinase